MSDLEQAVHFYQNKLGLQLLSRDVVARFKIDGVLFELVPTIDNMKLSGHGNARLCLEVKNIHEAVAELRDRGVPSSEIEEVQNGRFAVTKDPDGNQIVLWQYLF